MNKDILKTYEQACLMLKKDNTEESKQQYLILFKEVEVQLNKSFNDTIDKLSSTAKNLKEEINRVDAILRAIKNRSELRRKMIKDHKTYLGYEPLDLKNIEELDKEDSYIEYRDNLIEANKIIVELIRSGKKLKSRKAQLLRNPKNYDFIQSEIKVLQSTRNNTITKFKENKPVLEDLYNYCLTAPFNEENAYINYLIIKLKPLNGDSTSFNKENKRIIREVKKEKVVEVKEELPKLQTYGTVKPSGYISNLEKAMNDFDDISLPTNGLLEDENIVKIDINNIEE